MMTGPQGHAVASASGAPAWTLCPGKLRMEEGLPDTSGDAAKEGSCAHALAEITLKFETGRITKEEFDKEFHDFTENADYFNEDMVYHIDGYVDRTIEAYTSAKAVCPDAELYSELQVDFSDIVPDGWGTTDVAIVSDGYLHIIDLKYGHNKVPADTPQLKLYAIGCINEFEDLYDLSGNTRVFMTIDQPRINHRETITLTVDALKAWGEETIRPLAEEALSDHGRLIPGEVQCKYCRAAAICREHKEWCTEVMKSDYDDPDTLSPAEIADIMNRAEAIKSWLTSVTDYATEMVSKRKAKYPGWKLVRAGTKRKIADEDKAAEALTKAGYKPEDFYTQKLKGITELSRLCGKQNFELIMKGIVVKPEGKLQLAPVDDSREEVGGAQDYED